MLKKIINLYWRMIYGEWTPEQVREFMGRFDTVSGFQTWLVDQGFKWRSDGLNFSIQTDTFERPEQVLARKWANCGGFMRLFETFIKLRSAASEYTQYEISNSEGRWHYVMFFKIGDQWHCQSNLNIFPALHYVANIKQYFPQYTTVNVIDRWKLK